MTTPVILIRPISTDDIEGFWNALCSVIDEKNFLAIEVHPPIENTRTYINKGIDSGFIRLVAISENSVIGWCDIVPRSEDAPHIGIVGMGIIKHWRGQGLGEKLLRAALAAAQEKNFTTIRLDVWSENTAAIRLYEKLGFQHIRIYNRPEKPERQLCDMTWDGFPA